MKKELPKVYDPRDVENRIYQMWMEGNCFRSDPDPEKKPFSIVMDQVTVKSVPGKGTTVILKKKIATRAKPVER